MLLWYVQRFDHPSNAIIRPQEMRSMEAKEKEEITADDEEALEFHAAKKRKANVNNKAGARGRAHSKKGKQN